MFPLSSPCFVPFGCVPCIVPHVPCTVPFHYISLFHVPLGSPCTTSLWPSSMHCSLPLCFPVSCFLEFPKLCSFLLCSMQCSNVFPMYHTLFPSTIFSCVMFPWVAHAQFPCSVPFGYFPLRCVMSHALCSPGHDHCTELPSIVPFPPGQHHLSPLPGPGWKWNCQFATFTWKCHSMCVEIIWIGVYMIWAWIWQVGACVLIWSRIGGPVLSMTWG